MDEDSQSNILKYPYKPRMTICIFCIFSGILWMAVMIFDGIALRGLGACFGITVILLGVFLITRALLFQTCLTIDSETIVIPSGFGRLRDRRVAFASVKKLRHFNLPLTAAVQIETHDGERCEIVSTMLPKNEDYVQIVKLLMERTQT